MKTLTNDVINRLRTNGASIIGISNVERFDGAPRGHHPRDFVDKASSVVTFGVALLHNALHWEEHLDNSELVRTEHRKELLQNYFYMTTGYGMINDLLNRLALDISNFLESRGNFSLFFPATYESTRSLNMDKLIKKSIPSMWGLFSQRHAAVLSGLGEFGLNNLVVTPQYGPRIRFNSVITEAELTSSPIIENKVCLGIQCSVCVKECPGAISLRSNVNHDLPWYTPPAITNITACTKLSRRHYCLGRCIKVCPVAKKQSKD